MPFETGWRGVRDAVMARIRDGSYANGALIPTEAALAAEFGVARATVNRALRALAEDGLLDRRRRAGSRVAADPVRRATLAVPLVRRQIEARGLAYSAVLRQSGPAPLPTDLAARFGAGTAWHIVTEHRGGGALQVFEDRWVNPAAAPGIASADLGASNANEWLVRHVPYSHGTLDIAATSAGALAEGFGCAAEAAVLRLTRVTWLEAAWITWVAQTHAPGFVLASRL